MNTVPPSGFKWLRAPDWAESNLGHLSWRGGALEAALGAKPARSSTSGARARAEAASQPAAALAAN